MRLLALAVSASLLLATPTAFAAGGKARDSERTGPEWFARGMSLHGTEQFDEAIVAFRHAADAGYRPATARYNVACSQALKGDRDGALRSLETALAEGFEQPDLLADDDDLDSLRSDPRFEDLRRHAPERAETGRRGRALAGFRELTQRPEASGNDWYRTGSRLLAARELDRSVEALEKAATKLGYRGDSALYNLACAHALAGNRDRALEALARAVEAGYDDPRHLRQDDDLRSLRGDARFLAIAEDAKALSLGRFWLGTSGLWDWIGMKSAATAPAVTHFRNYVREHPASGRGWFNLGFTSLAAGEFEEARGAFERALELGYRRPTSMYNLACVHARAGNSAVALDWLEKSAAAGFEVASHARGDRDLRSLRGEARFERLAGSDDESKSRHGDEDEE